MHTLPVAIFIEIYRQGHQRAVDRVDWKRVKRRAEEDKGRGECIITSSAITADFTIALAQQKYLQNTRIVNSECV